MSRDIGQDSVGRYEAAVARVELVQEAWMGAGKPLTTRGVGREFSHPLWVMLVEAERDAERFAKALGPARAKGGRPQATSSSPDRRPGRLKAV